MKEMKIYILSIIASMLVVSCSDYKYPQNIEVSERSGAPVDSSASYLLEELEFDGATHLMAWDKNELEQLNRYYRMASEPILYNYYVGRDIYRFFLVERDRLPLILSVNKTKDRSWIVYKQIFKIEQVAENCGIKMVEDYVNRTKDMNEEEWETFHSLWKASEFYHLTNSDANKASDSFCIIEAHEKDKYWSVNRPLTDQSLKDLSIYVRSLVKF